MDLRIWRMNLHELNCYQGVWPCDFRVSSKSDDESSTDVDCSIPVYANIQEQGLLYPKNEWNEKLRETYRGEEKEINSF